MVTSLVFALLGYRRVPRRLRDLHRRCCAPSTYVHRLSYVGFGNLSVCTSSEMVYVIFLLAMGAVVRMFIVGGVVEVLGVRVLLC